MFKTYAGRITGISDRVTESAKGESCSVYEFVEIEDESGQFVSIPNLMCGSQVRRSIRQGNQVELLIYKLAWSKKKILNFASAVHDHSSNRVFEDKKMLVPLRREYFIKTLAYATMALILGAVTVFIFFLGAVPPLFLAYNSFKMFCKLPSSHEVTDSIGEFQQVFSKATAYQ